MSLEECKRIAERRLKRARTRAKIEGESRHAEGWYGGEHVEIDLYAEHIGMSFQTWIVTVFSVKHRARSKKTFQNQMKKLAIEYFEELLREYGLEEAEEEPVILLHPAKIGGVSVAVEPEEEG